MNELTCAIMGLYEAEGGKIGCSFTNSQPRIINTFLDFIEKIFHIKRKDLTASINCHEESAVKKRNLEEFWRNQTGIEKFQNRLHITNKTKSANGILQIFFGSKILKEFICGMFRLVFENNKIDNNSVIRGILSGDGSPILQTNSCITHHIATDKNHIEFQEKFIYKIFEGKTSTIKNLKNKKIVAYNNWKDNLNFLLYIDTYKYNVFNRLKFAKQFLELKATKKFMLIKNGDIVIGVDIARKKTPIKEFVKAGYIRLIQISPKPNKKYKIQLTKQGIDKQIEIKDFIEYTLPQYKEDVRTFENTLKQYNLT